jgi:nucleoside-diphosphate-sugar epimerase
MRTLIVGGTGPSGVALVHALVAAGDDVTIFHTGAHEPPLPDAVTHIHGDPGEYENLGESLAGRAFDRAVSTSGRVRHVARVLAGRVRRFVSVSGLPAYASYSRFPVEPFVGPLPLREDDPRTSESAADRHAAHTAMAERSIMEAHDRGDFEAVILRYTMVYGPYAYLPFEWYFVKRALDGRARLVLESDGLTVPQRGYGPNLAHGVVLALDAPSAAGQIINLGDERSLTVRGIADEVARALNHHWEIVSVPLAMSPCSNPFSMRGNTFFDLHKARTLLGYRDAVGVEEATRATSFWMRDNPPEPGGFSERSLGSRAFDYEREDRVADSMSSAS